MLLQQILDRAQQALPRTHDWLPLKQKSRFGIIPHLSVELVAPNSIATIIMKTPSAEFERVQRA
jgi:hypothetical protein